MPIVRSIAFGAALAIAIAASAAACGETRRPIGDECLRDDDCLSEVCSDRICVAAPTLVTGASSEPPDQTPLIPPSDAATKPSDGGPG